MTYLEHLVAHLEDDGVLHAVVLDEKIHVFGPRRVDKGPLDIASERLGHVVLKVLEEVCLALQALRVVFEGVMATRVDVAVFVRNVVEVADERRGRQYAGHLTASDKSVHLVRREDHRGAVVEVQSRRAVRERIGRAILVRVIDPGRDEDFGRLER